MARSLVNDSAAAGSSDRIAGVTSFSATYYLSPRWPLRLTWQRVFAEHSPDTDLLVMGVAYRF